MAHQLGQAIEQHIYEPADEGDPKFGTEGHRLRKFRDELQAIANNIGERA